MNRHVAQARQVLRKVLAGRLTFTPRTGRRPAYYEFEGEGRLEPILAGLLLALLPKGDQVLQRCWPQRDSNPCFSLESDSGAIPHGATWREREWLQRAMPRGVQGAANVGLAIAREPR